MPEELPDVQRWEPSLAEIIGLYHDILSLEIPRDRRIPTFLHGAPIHDAELDLHFLLKMVRLFEEGTVGTLLLNGMSREDCERRNIAYGGVEAWYALNNARVF